MDKKNSKSNKNIHEGHRKRLVDLACNAGLDNLSDVQVVELFLSYIFPRGDVNPLAHRLLDEYENFANIISAESADLQKIDGINERSAKLIYLFNELFYYYVTSRMGKKFVVSRKADLVDIAEDVLRFRNTENLLLIALSAGNIVTHKRRINRKSATEVGISMMDVADFITNAKPVSMAIAHCHPYGSAQPSESDKKSFKEINEFCQKCGVCLIDSFIIGEDGVFSQDDDVMIRKYFDIEAINEMF